MDIRAIGDILYARRWLVLGVLVVMLLLTPLFARVLRPTYQATSEIALIGNSAGGSAVLPPSDIPELALSAPVLQRAIGHLRLHDSVEDLRGKISAKASPKSDILPITFSDKDAYRALTIPNAVADATVFEYKALAARQYDQAVVQLKAQLADERSKIREVDGRLQRAIQQDTYASSTNAADSLSTRLFDLAGQRASANATYVADLAASSEQQKTGGLAAVIKEQALASDPYYTALRANQAKDKAEEVSVRAGYTDAFPGLAGLREKASREDAAARQAAQIAASEHTGASTTYAQLLLSQKTAATQVAGDRARLAAIDRQISETRAHLKDLPNSGVASNALRLQRDSSAAAYQQLAVRLQTTLADQAQTAALNSVVVIDYARQASPKIPAALLATLVALLIVILSIGVAFAAEVLDPRLRRPVEVENLYGIPRFGSISR